ncbi:TonB-dependent receptor [Aquimarina litoralis]|uniref:TonB-dependent receptor n=1 Tax=Aquimarina litoralis TaxID=584605 RepID=UPI001C5A056F|nr:TonB-dependent receptor [Aquimarina litoralis]MBW1296155.1 TonB-dependent receptor plug domain-containing protein [Aquimarina litoralis]
MKKQTQISKGLLLFLFFFPLTFFAQEIISGTITNSTNGDVVPFVNILEKGTSNGTTSDFDGNFSMEVKSLPVTLIVSAVGFGAKEVSVTSSAPVTITLEEGAVLDEIVIVGNRAKPRTVIESPVAIDNISSEELAISAQPEVDKMIAFRVPSYNSTQQTISDATAHFDPSELRNLGPSRTLVLVNGKRKNQSALVYVNETPGRGEVGVDMKSIPAAAIERVEVLRDGAAAQYGSDAIAGVINIILKESPSKTTVNLGTGVTTEGDGFTYSGSLNTTINPDFGGYINLTADFYHQDYTNRAGEPGNDLLFGNIFGDQTLIDGTDPWIQANPDLGMIVGQPEYDRLGLAVNAGFPYADNTAEFYAFGSFQKRDGKSFALYRTPYWVPDPFNLLHPVGTEYQGFQPTFETDIRDNSFTLGNKWQMFGGWNFDISYTFGRNAVGYEVNNSLNPSLGANSPTSFNPGGYSFSNQIGNLDIAKSFGDVSVTLGSEVRQERFITRAGEVASYIDGGVQSFPGLRPENALNETRSNIGVYGGIDWDITDAFLISAAGRYEDYSDFGENVSWKVAARYLLNDKKGAIRASVNTGFRAPSLHQIYLSNIQTLQLADGSIGQQGTFNNVDPVIIDPVNGLGVPQLDAEESFNIAGGITYRFSPKFSVAVDYYNIKVEDRVLLTNPLGFDGDDTTVNAVEQVLIDNSIGNVTFFVNAVDTKTQGVDLVANYRGLSLGKGTLDVNAAFNWNETDIDGTISVPDKILNAGYTDIFNREEQSRITTARPNLKGVLGFTYNISKFSFVLNNTYFGEVTWQHPTNPDFDQTFAGKVLTDLSISYEFASWVTAKVTGNNILNVFPDEIETFGDFGTDLGGRFRYPWEVNQFGFNGTFIQGGLTFSF